MQTVHETDVQDAPQVHVGGDVELAYRLRWQDDPRVARPWRTRSIALQQYNHMHGSAMDYALFINGATPPCARRLEKHL
eukprot:6181623-Pleurochrysis_carterae.AAC.1